MVFIRVRCIFTESCCGAKPVSLIALSDEVNAYNTLTRVGSSFMISNPLISTSNGLPFKISLKHLQSENIPKHQVLLN
ncbi:unnamed protein product [Brugia timori]|uniref:Uncharacterized protein n=1 Tax=Brugia timori TaxID=42155 RepID=A0A3P7VM35_9BILA|nr:unnamed protein product [Brugia timori]